MRKSFRQFNQVLVALTLVLATGSLRSSAQTAELPEPVMAMKSAVENISGSQPTKWLPLYEHRRPAGTAAPRDLTANSVSANSEYLLDSITNAQRWGSKSRAADSIPNNAAAAVVSGVPAAFSLPAVSNPTLFSGDYGYRVVVPAGATRLQISTVTTTPGADVDLYVRYGTDVELANGTAVADFRSEGPTGNETVIISSSSSPALLPGTYYIAFGLFTTGTAVQGTVTATLTTPSGTANPTVFVVGNYSLPAVSTTTLFAGDYGYQIVVPQGASRLEVRSNTSSTAEVHLYLRYGQDVDLDSNGYVLADYVATERSGNQTIVITPSSSPSLRAGTYYVGFGVFTVGSSISGTVTASIAGPGASVGGSSQVLNANYSLPAVSTTTLFTGDYGYQFVVPPGTGRLEVHSAAGPNAEVHLYLRYGQDLNLDSDGYVLADYFATDRSGNQTIVVTPSSSPSLRAGTYYVGFGVFTMGSAVSGTVTATISQ
jgi:hypothetical protein